MTYFVYERIDPRTNETRYIGQTKDLEKREEIHSGGSTCGNSLKWAWQVELKALGLKPVVRTLESCETREEARELEKKWIKHYLELGHQLTNMQVVGQGKWNAYRRCPKETLAVRGYYI